ncbi:putative ubiquitin 3 binding protein But2 [Septoria linicola]|nr:putative ubiquitin 3 binding protein But2 [Septoria linicola]
MKAFIAAAAALLTTAIANPLVQRKTGCCFHVTANGGPGGRVQQLDDGQNRIGQSGLKDGEYCTNSQGGLVDSNGKGCIFTPPTAQWQCDAGAKPTPGAYVDAAGVLTYNASTQFWTCPTGDNGGWNLYGRPLLGEPKCVPVKLLADGCNTPEPPAVVPPPSRPSQCPADLPKVYEFPHLIVPISQNEPSKSYGTSYNGTAGAGISSLFNFDIPESAKGKTCNVKFLFPQQRQLETSAYTFSQDDGGFTMAMLKSPATETTTYASAPKIQHDLGTFALTPSSAFDIASISCPAGEKLSVWLQAVGSSYIDFFQDFNPCPIGLYVIAQ